MLKSVSTLLGSKKDKKVGNHATYWTTNFMDDQVQYFTYHGNIICRVNWTRGMVYLTTSGWNTRSTNRALNDYKRFFLNDMSRKWEIEDMREDKE